MKFKRKILIIVLIIIILLFSYINSKNKTLLEGINIKTVEKKNDSLIENIVI
jgi:hypothetical protein